MKQANNIYHEYLVEQGYRPSLDPDGDIVFKKEGKTYVIILDGDDPEYFRMILPNFWPIESPEEKTEALIACDHSNSMSKAVKLHISQENVWASIEFYLINPADLGKLFDRMFPAIMNGIRNFAEKMKELEKNRKSNESKTNPQ